MRRVLFVFVDGVGLAPRAVHNPLSTLALPALAALAGGQAWTSGAAPLRRPGHVFVPLDATLGVEGLPQSGTGQAALFAGFNAPELHGAHYGPAPPTTVRARLAAESLFARFRERGVAPDAMAFANAYPARFFAAMARRPRWTATTIAARGAGVRLRTAADLARGAALASDYTGAGWQRVIDPEAAPISEAEAGRRLVRLSHEHRLTLSEYPYTDHAGHGRAPHTPEAVLPSVDRLLGAVVAELDAATDLLLVSSDHGNIEDTRVETHTRNPVPLVAWGAGAHHFASATSLVDVVPALMAWERDAADG